MSYSNPDIELIEEAKGIDSVIQSIQVDLSSLDWLEKSFGRAWVFDDDGGKVPKVYQGQGEYLNVLPNDFLRAQSFITASGPETVTEYKQFTMSSLERNLNIFFWVNLQEIDPNTGYIFTERLKNEVEKILKRNRWVKTINNYFDERADQVFEGFTLPENTQYLMYPYSGFRFEITVAYFYQNCILPTAPPVDPGNTNTVFSSQFSNQFQ